MCYSDGHTYRTRTYIANGSRVQEEYTVPRRAMSWRRRYGLGGTYYPPRYYTRPPSGRYMNYAAMYANGHARYAGYPQSPRYSQALVPAGGYSAYSSGYGGYYRGARVAMPHHAAMRTYYDAAPGYGYATQAHVYPPGPTATTTTTTYHVTNSHAGPARAVHQPVPAPCAHGPTRGDIQTENRRVATERGAYSARRIKPADARNDDPFWCRERNGEWHLRSYYQIENECHPGRWLMDAEAGFLVFHRE